MGHIACNHCGLVLQCRCRDHQIHAVMADFCAQAPSAARFLDAKVENRTAKNIVILWNQACKITANSRFLGICNRIPRSISPSVMTLAKSSVSGLPLTQSATPDARSGRRNADMTSVSLTYIQKVTSRGSTCSRSISQPGKDNR